MAGLPDPKPAKRIVDSVAGKMKVATEGRCRLCGATWPLNRHHLVERSVGGDDVDDNIVPLCGSGTTGCHGDVTDRRNGARARLRSRLTERELAYVVFKKGLEWLEQHYPSELLREAA